MHIDFRKCGVFNIFGPDIAVMEMESQLIMLQDFTNGLLRLAALLQIYNEYKF